MVDKNPNGKRQRREVFSMMFCLFQFLMHSFTITSHKRIVTCGLWLDIAVARVTRLLIGRNGKIKMLLCNSSSVVDVRNENGIARIQRRNGAHTFHTLKMILLTLLCVQMNRKKVVSCAILITYMLLHINGVESELDLTQNHFH